MQSVNASPDIVITKMIYRDKDRILTQGAEEWALKPQTEGETLRDEPNVAQLEGHSERCGGCAPLQTSAVKKVNLFLYRSVSASLSTGVSFYSPPTPESSLNDNPL